MKQLAVTLVMVAACTALPDLARQPVCGNGVIEPGEDCDNPTAGCQQCRLVCTNGGCPGADGVAIAGYVCGADGMCHAPSGIFSKLPTSSFSLPVRDGRVIDVNGDGIGDVVGVSDGSIIVHFGDPAGKLDAQQTILTPLTTGSAQFTTLAGSAEILLPTADGIAAYVAQSGTLLPHLFTVDPRMFETCPALGMATVRAMFALDRLRLGFVAEDKVTRALGLGVLETSTVTCHYMPACGMVGNGLPFAPEAKSVDVYSTTTVTAAMSAVVAIAFGSSVCAMRIKDLQTTMPAFAIQPLLAAAWPSDPMRGADPPLLARIASPACPSLVGRDPVSKAVQAYAPGVIDATGCTLGASPSPLTNLKPDDVAAMALPLGRIALMPLIPGQGPDAVVLTSAVGFSGSSNIYAVNGTAATWIYQADRPISLVQSADIDGDGTVEAIAGSISPDLDILYRVPGVADGVQSLFLPYRIATVGRPTHLVVGDYDGNGITDIGYAEAVAPGERLMVAYGTRDRPLDAVEVDAFTNIVAIAPVFVPDAVDPGGHVDDLVVVDLATPDQPTLTLLHGSPQRVMLSYYDPRISFGTSQFIAALPVDFGAAPGDIFAIEQSNTATTAWALLGRGGGQLGSSASAIVPFGLTEVCTAELCTPNASFARWPGATKDLIIAIDQSVPFHAVVIDPTVDNNNNTLALTVTPIADLTNPMKVEADLAASAIAIGDIDGTPGPELVVGFAPKPMTMAPPGVSRVEICNIADDQTASCSSLSDVTPELVGTTCEAASTGLATARGRLDRQPDPGYASDLIAVCHPAVGGSALVRVHHDATGYHANTIVPDAGGAAFVRLGDVTGDGIDDILAVTHGADFLPVLAIYPQCEARDIACRAANEVLP